MRLYNTLTGRKEEFAPADGVVKMYVCGITPYDRSHLGHAMSYIIFDALRRYLEYRGFRVRHVQNYTDIDDKIIARAQRLGLETAELAEQHIAEYVADMRGLNVLPAHVYPRATQEIPTMIQMVQGLMEKGYGYATDGDVYFRVARKADYGKLAHRNLDSMLAGARIEPVPGKKENPMDFTLWKAAKPGEPTWESPWGLGRPGWHIECSAMSLKYLGETIDIHGGGMDLVFPHHENEIAQSEAYTGRAPFARFWMHHGLLQLGEEKMSKSLENIIPIGEALRRYSADAIRLFVLGSHYRSPLTYREESLLAARRGAQRLRLAAHPSDVGEGAELDGSPYRQRFLEAMEDDFNTAQAVASLFDLAREINRARAEGMQVAAAQATLRELAGVLGLTLAEAEAGLEVGPFIDLLLEVRNELRRQSLFPLADAIRRRLAHLGILLEDTPQGTHWRPNEE
ncbi:MAG: cysteine--tRNA ligase [Dehalococcoidia bacterium]